MADILIRNVPDEVVTAIDHAARRLGLSRVEYLRRSLANQHGWVVLSVTVDDLARAADLCSDLLDPEVMDRAWQ
jgi:hypothetical protein